jgi:hypothetical protein
LARCYFLFLLIPCRLWKRWDRCCKMGPACHPLCTIKVSFLGLFSGPDIWSLAFFFRSHATFETLRNLLAHGSHMSAYKQQTFPFLELFDP